MQDGAPDYTCLTVPDVWVYGSGMDLDELHRNQPGIWQVSGGTAYNASLGAAGGGVGVPV